MSLESASASESTPSEALRGSLNAKRFQLCMDGRMDLSPGGVLCLQRIDLFSQGDMLLLSQQRTQPSRTSLGNLDIPFLELCANGLPDLGPGGVLCFQRTDLLLQGSLLLLGQQRTQSSKASLGSLDTPLLELCINGRPDLSLCGILCLQRGDLFLQGRPLLLGQLTPQPAPGPSATPPEAMLKRHVVMYPVSILIYE